MKNTLKLLSRVPSALLIGLFAPAVLAGVVSPDQENQVVISENWSAVYLGPIGQEFVPGNQTLNMVELFVANMDLSSPFASDIEVNIRQGSMTGMVLGTSLQVNVLFEYSGIAHFDFPATVNLVPGNMNVIELVVPPGGGNVAAGGGWTTSYLPGRLILAGRPIPQTDNSDLWFREGTDHHIKRKRHR